jgi:hypothetical protein
MSQMIDDIFYGPVVVGVGLALLAVQLVVLVMAVRRRRRGLAPLPLSRHAVAGVLIAALPIAIGISVHAARASLLAVFHATGAGDPSERATTLSYGLGSQMSALPFAVTVTGLALVLWFIGLAYTLSAPRADGRARGFPPAALVAVGLLPTAFGVLQWSLALITAFASIAGKLPDEKVAIITRVLDTGHAELARYARISMMAIPVLAVIAAAMIVMGARDQAGAPRRSPRLPLAVSAAAILVAALLVVQARPMAAENDMPWPAPSGGVQMAGGGPPTPDVTGPEPIERAPVVHVYRDRIGLDGTTDEDFESLESKLVTLRNNYRLLHPSETFNGMALIFADPATPSARLTSVLRAVREADYHMPMFGFGRTESLLRPTLGKVERYIVTGAQIRVAYPDGVDEFEYDDEAEAARWKQATPLRLQDFADYGAFARKLVELRRAGQPVLVTIDRAPR